MKTTFFLALFCLVCLSIFVMWTKHAINDHDISITVKEDDDSYKFSASFDAMNTSEVWRYINKCISPNALGKSEKDYFDATASLQDKTTFYIKEAPGKLKIELNKRQNSTASYLHIKKICEGVKDILGGKQPSN